VRVVELPDRVIDAFGSRGVRLDALPSADVAGEYVVRVAHLEPGGHLGRHPAVLWQVFAVVEGEGSVAGEDGVRRRIAPGQAAIWSPGEQHDTRADSRMTAVVVESTAEPVVGQRFRAVLPDFTDTPEGR
jgi:quercetin dioxygenase-like cupin family protein